MHGNHYREPSRLVVIEGSPLVPSLMIYSHKHERWLAGQEAANYYATPQDRIYANWKRSLYSKVHNEEVDAHMDAATQFFTWLGSQLKKADIGIRESVIKICLPAFEGAEKPANLLLERMKRCGWAGRSHTTVSEPGSNTIGIFGEGNNASNRYADTGDIHPFYMENFPQGGLFLGHLQNHALRNGARLVTFMILDIGSFTADISVCTLDAQRDGDCLQSVKQHSFELGLVEHYEAPLFNELLERRGLPASALTFTDKERIKAAMNDRESLQVALPNGTSVAFGVEEDFDASNALTREFSERLIATVQRFLGEEKPNYCVMTGGGASIAILRGQMEDALQRLGMRVLPAQDFDPADTASEGQNVSTMEWPQSGETLERLATALGASSVLMDLPTHEPPEEQPVPMETADDWIYCSCNGGNKNCQKCNGLGMLRRSNT
jgi:hypothetical protein